MPPCRIPRPCPRFTLGKLEGMGVPRQGWGEAGVQSGAGEESVTELVGGWVRGGGKIGILSASSTNSLANSSAGSAAGNPLRLQRALGGVGHGQWGARLPTSWERLQPWELSELLPSRGKRVWVSDPAVLPSEQRLGPE